MAVRAKFRVESVVRTEHTYGAGTEINFSPVTHDYNDPTSENSTFWDATPGGHLKINCANEAAVAQFRPGAEFYVDFTAAKKEGR